MIRHVGEKNRKACEQWIVFWLNRCAELNGGCEYCGRVIDCTKQYDSLMNAFYDNNYAKRKADFLKYTMEI